MCEINWHDLDKEIPPRTGDYLVIYATTLNDPYVVIGMKIDHFVNEENENVLYNRTFSLPLNRVGTVILAWSDLPDIPKFALDKMSKVFDHIENRKYLFAGGW